MGEIMSEIADANRRVRMMMRTQQADVRPEPHVITPEDVTRGLGVFSTAETKITTLVRSSMEPATEQTKLISPKRAAMARSTLLGFLRTEKSIDSDTRQEIMRRALTYWKNNFRVDYGRTAQLRRSTGKPRLLLRKADGGGGMPATGAHKYIARKPDGRGGWLYKYPGDPSWRSDPNGGAEGTEKPGIEPGHEQFRPTVDQGAEGDHHVHFGEGVSAHIPTAAGKEHHKAEWQKHKKGFHEAMAADDEEKAQAHLGAYRLHAEAHNAFVDQEEKGAAKGMAPPGKGVPPQVQQDAKARAGGKLGGAPGGPGGRPPANAGAAGGASFGGEDFDEAQQAPTPGGDRVPASQHVGALRQGVQQASQVMSDLAGAHAHIADIDQRIKAVKSGRGDAGRKLDPRESKRQVATLKAEKAQAELDRMQLEDQHDAAMQNLKGLQKKVLVEKLKHSPIAKMITGLLALMDKFAKATYGGPSKSAGKEGAAGQPEAAPAGKAAAVKPPPGAGKGKQLSPSQVMKQPSPMDNIARAKAQEAPKAAPPTGAGPAAPAPGVGIAPQTKSERSLNRTPTPDSERDIAAKKKWESELSEAQKHRDEAEAKVRSKAEKQEAKTIPPRIRRQMEQRAQKSLREATRLADEIVREVRAHALDGVRLIIVPPPLRRPLMVR